MNSIRVRLIVLFIVLTTSTLGVFGIYAHLRLSGELEERFSQLKAGTVSRLQINLQEPLWNFDVSVIIRIIEAEMLPREVRGIHISSVSSGIVAGATRDDEDRLVRSTLIGKANSVLDGGDVHPLTITVPGSKKAEEFGQLVVHFSRDQIDRTLRAEITRRVLEVLAVDIVLVLALTFSLRMVFGPLGQLRNALFELAEQDGEDIEELPEARTSEFGEVIQGFNKTQRKFKHVVERRGQAEAAARAAANRTEQALAQLKSAQNELVDTARRAGMVEIATNVLHNVGNVLNSVNVSADLIGRQARSSKTAGLTKAMQLMNDNASHLGDYLTHDEKGKRLPDYLNQLAKTLAAEQQSIIEESDALTKNIDHIKDIVATQQSYAGASSVVEPVQIQDLLEDALRMNAEALTQQGVEVVKEFAEVPVLPLDRHRILQILVNLISNAKHAMDGAGDHGHRLTLRVNVTNGVDGHRLQICVVDQGEGIPAENMPRIFVHGFTTRQEGHGFGLHSCALAAKAMGGTLTAQSDGPGRGAIFMLELPIDATGKVP